MRVLHVPFTYYPDASGGTEVYVQALARRTEAYGVTSLVAASAAADACYLHEDVVVERFALGPTPTLRDVYGDGDLTGAAKFEAILDRQRPDVVHFHAFTMGASLRMAEAARRRGVPVVFTYHTPTASCVRGTLMYRGQSPCDGELRTGRCARCALAGRGAGTIASGILGSLPPAVGEWIGRTGRAGPAWTALRFTELTELRHRSFRRLLDLAARIVVPCEWARELLLRNGLPHEKLMLCRQGLAQLPDLPNEPRTAARRDVTRLAFLGRLSPEKGIDLLVAAMREARSPQLRLDLYGTAQGAEGGAHEEALRELVASDPRIRLLRPVPSQDVVTTLREYDALVVPSRWMETGPLVVLEAFAAGIPVVGSALGGIAELVTHDVDGLLVAGDSVAAWTKALDSIAREPVTLARLAARVKPPRDMDQVTREMVALYHQLGSGPLAGAMALEARAT